MAAATSPSSGTIGQGYLRAEADGRTRSAGSAGNVAPWEELAIEAVGNVIEFWGFKRNQGRVWALLYLRNIPMTAGELQHALGLSKGAISMLTKDLEKWQVVRRVRMRGEASWRFEANTDFMQMIGHVLASREAEFLRRVRVDLDAAAELADDDDEISPEARRRLRRMSRLARKVDEAVDIFRRTARLDLQGLAGILTRSVRRRMGTRS